MSVNQALISAHHGHYLNQCWRIPNWTQRNKFQWNFNQNSTIFLNQNGFRYAIWKMADFLSWLLCVNTLRPRQNGRYFADDIFKCIFLNENEWISVKISLKFVPKVRIDNIPALVQIMAWRRPGDKPLSEPMMVNLSTHICVTRAQWVKTPSMGNVNATGHSLQSSIRAFEMPPGRDKDRMQAIN